MKREEKTELVAITPKEKELLEFFEFNNKNSEFRQMLWAMIFSSMFAVPIDALDDELRNACGVTLRLHQLLD